MGGWSSICIPYLYFLLYRYTGHCPQFRFREGKTYGKLTHKLLVDPCTKHAPELIVTAPNQPFLEDYPTEKEVRRVQQREELVDAAYKYPMLPGYDGFVPNLFTKIGKRYLAAATAGVAEHENLMELYRCQNRNLRHSNLIQGGYGIFNNKLCERMVSNKRNGVKLEGVLDDLRSYRILISLLDAIDCLQIPTRSGPLTCPNCKVGYLWSAKGENTLLETYCTSFHGSR